MPYLIQLSGSGIFFFCRNVNLQSHDRGIGAFFLIKTLIMQPSIAWCRAQMRWWSVYSLYQFSGGDFYKYLLDLLWRSSMIYCSVLLTELWIMTVVNKPKWFRLAKDSQEIIIANWRNFIFIRNRRIFVFLRVDRKDEKKPQHHHFIQLQHHRHHDES